MKYSHVMKTNIWYTSPWKISFEKKEILGLRYEYLS